MQTQAMTSAEKKTVCETRPNDACRVTDKHLICTTSCGRFTQRESECESDATVTRGFNHNWLGDKFRLRISLSRLIKAMNGAFRFQSHGAKAIAKMIPLSGSA